MHYHYLLCSYQIEAACVLPNNNNRNRKKSTSKTSVAMIFCLFIAFIVFNVIRIILPVGHHIAVSTCSHRACNLSVKLLFVSKWTPEFKLVILYHIELGQIIRKDSHENDRGLIAAQQKKANNDNNNNNSPKRTWQNRVWRYFFLLFYT